MEFEVNMGVYGETLGLEIWEQIGRKLRKSKAAVRKAVYHALEIQDQFTKDLVRKGSEILQGVLQQRARANPGEEIKQASG
jgi:hypothetical protein